MYTRTYARISAPFRRLAHGRLVIVTFDRVLVGLIAAAYLGSIAWMVATGDDRALRLIMVPAFSFIFVTVLRAALNAKRPYELFAIDPLIPRNRAGKSFPSRHVFSAAIIACTLGYVYLPWGIAAFIAASIVACLRVIGGVHFPRDVLAALILALACGAIGFVLIP